MVVKTKKNKETNNNNGLDEKGRPKPMTNPKGGDPICPGGWKIDNDFDAFDPINPPFTCISALKDPSDSNQINKIMNNLNNPSNNITGLATNMIIPPAAGGGRTPIRRRRHTRQRMNVKRSRRGRSRRDRPSKV
jgi:hypothetical protein